MTRKKKKMPQRPKQPGPRDPYWRARRVLGKRVVENMKAYSRSAVTASTRKRLQEDS